MSLDLKSYVADSCDPALMKFAPTLQDARARRIIYLTFGYYFNSLRLGGIKAERLESAS